MYKIRKMSVDEIIVKLGKEIEKLKPCPCCGGKMGYEIWKDEEVIAQFKCEGCGVRSRPFRAVTIDDIDLRLTVGLWNMRVEKNESETA